MTIDGKSIVTGRPCAAALMEHHHPFCRSTLNSMRPDILGELVKERRIAADWVDALRAADPKIDDKLTACLAKVSLAGPCLPTDELIWRAYELPLADVRVLILGQDPYPNPDHAVGLSFSTGPGGPIPDSLRNIFNELNHSGYRTPSDGDLSGWADRGVMLLNRALTLPHTPDARPRIHVGWWKPLIVATAKAIDAEAAHRPIAALLWGVPAQRLAKHLGQVEVFTSSHPTTRSASRRAADSEPFLGSGVFSKVDQCFASHGAEPVGWGLPREPTPVLPSPGDRDEGPSEVVLGKNQAR